MTGLLIAALILFLLAVLPVGAAVRYEEAGPVAAVVLGPLRIQLLPKKGKKKKTKTEKKPRKKKRQEKSVENSVQEKPKKKGGSVKDFIPFVKMGLNLLGDFRRKLRVNNLELKVTLAGSDPADLAINYSRAWAALGNFWPVLERAFKIKKRDVSVQCDFSGEETTVYAALTITITLGRVIALVVKYGIQALKEFIKLKNKKKAVQSV